MSLGDWEGRFAALDNKPGDLPFIVQGLNCSGHEELAVRNTYITNRQYLSVVLFYVRALSSDRVFLCLKTEVKT